MQKVSVIAGPTASGKSAYALEIAQKQPAVIINADSMQVYRDFPILTAQPSLDEQAQTPHKLYGFIGIHEKNDAATWSALATSEIHAAWSQNKLPILVGGTGLYLKTLIQGIAPIPEIPEEHRKKAAELLSELGHADFHARLLEKDPTSAHLKIGDTQRVLRAYEVVEATGKPLSYWHAQPTRKFLEADFEGKIILPDRADLYARCDARFGQMIEKGGVAEVQKFPLTTTIKIIGVPEIQAFLRGEISKDTAIEKASQATRNYAKRQYTWFRNQDLGFQKI